MDSLGRRVWSLRVRPQLSDPWTVVTAGLGAGVGWAVGLPTLAVAAVGATMLGAAAVAAIFRDPGEPDVEEAPLRRGTEQAALLGALDGYLKDLRELRESRRLPQALTDSAIEALVAAGGARTSAARVAEAVDALDGAIARATDLAGRTQVSAGTASTLGRMADRRADLLKRLGAALAEVQEVHANLLELSATVEITPGASDLGDVAGVNQRLESLRSAFSELEHDAVASIQN